LVLICFSCGNQEYKKPAEINRKENIDSALFINLFNKKIDINITQDSLIKILNLHELAEFNELGSGHYGNIFFQQYQYANMDFFTSVYCDFKNRHLIKLTIVFQGNVEDNKKARKYFKEQNEILLKCNKKSYKKISVDTSDNNSYCSKLIWEFK